MEVEINLKIKPCSKILINKKVRAIWSWKSCKFRENLKIFQWFFDVFPYQFKVVWYVSPCIKLNTLRGKTSPNSMSFEPILHIYVLNIIENPVTYVYNIGIPTLKKNLESFFQILIHHRDAPSWWARHKIGHLNQYRSQIWEILGIQHRKSVGIFIVT